MAPHAWSDPFFISLLVLPLVRIPRAHRARLWQPPGRRSTPRRAAPSVRGDRRAGAEPPLRCWTRCREDPPVTRRGKGVACWVCIFDPPTGGRIRPPRRPQCGEGGGPPRPRRSGDRGRARPSQPRSTPPMGYHQRDHSHALWRRRAYSSCASNSNHRTGDLTVQPSLFVLPNLPHRGGRTSLTGFRSAQTKHVQASGHENATIGVSV